MKRIFNIAATLMLLISAASAQNIGFTISRGVSGLYPNTEYFKRTHSQMIGIGLTHSAEVRKDLDFQTGLYIAANSTTGSMKDANGTVVLLPRWYYYLEIPFHYSTKLHSFGDRKTNTYLKGLYGANIGFLWHEKAFQNNDWSDDKGELINYGGTVALQYVNQASANMEFAIGPQIKAMTTGQAVGKINISYGLRLDWRFNY